ncbi:hypothetical protein OUZ56_011943 [Daphnia magna]|uniref:Uncharacterized protein n=1 Tax=Daphnia magna TaxID=35525 RepID=A0ABQ9Z1W6_9CRUS|nr:hypothetical protein OUZ56_011943 [Daphnia magna]
MAAGSPIVIDSQPVDGSRIDESDPRFLLSTFTIVISTVTSTSTIGTTTTCTTSSSAMNACSAIGRRRRGILYDNDNKLSRLRRGLFYDDDDMEEKEVNIPLAEETRRH